MSDRVPDISVVVPVYRNAPTLRELYRRLREVMNVGGSSYELLCVDDASPDGSLKILNDLALQGPVVVVPMPCNVGQHRAVLQGLRHARGATVVILDADLQDPPEAIPLLLARLREGFAAVYGAQRGRFQSPFRRLTSRMFKASVHVLADVPLDMGPFSAMDRRMVDKLIAATTERPFIPAMMVETGLPIASVPVVRSRRPAGRSAYTNWDRLTRGLSVIGGILSSRRRGRPRVRGEPPSSPRLP
jgi:glycosyltransferase involved in cell wall biosynthesis